MRERLERIRKATDPDWKYTVMKKLGATSEDVVCEAYVLTRIADEAESGNLISISNLIGGITNFSKEYYHEDGYGNFEDLTAEYLNETIDEYLEELED